jgi:hypothetical protein
MPDEIATEPKDENFKDAAQRSQEAGIADESAAYELAQDDDAPASLDEGKPESGDDGTFTSETD